MDRVGIVTIVDEQNYGNRLQNYALQCALESLGIGRAETIRNSPRPELRSLRARRAAVALRKAPVTTLSRNFRRWKEHRDASAAAGNSSPAPALDLSEFTRTYIHEYPLHFDAIADKRELSSLFDAFVVGSDQVWNPGFRNANEIDFLTFARSRQRIAYSASFGVQSVPDYLRDFYRRRLREIPAISVRETTGARIVSELIGRSVPVVLDPTLVVPSTTWTSLASTPREFQERDYAVGFFLGGFHEGEQERLEGEFRSEGLELIDYRSHPWLAGASPEVFLGTLRAAKVVVTDSFHAAALSLALDTPFRVRFRHAGDARMDALFSLLGTRTDGDGPLVPSLAWDAVHERTETARRRSLAWLRDALEAATPA